MLTRISESAGVLVAALFLAPVVLLFISKLRARRDFDYAMRQVAKHAVTVGRAEHGLELDFSPASIERVENVLAELHNRHLQTPLPDREISRLALRWGAYIGEVMKLVRPAKWRRDSENAGAGAMPLIFDASNEAFPCSWVYKRIVDGPDDNVLFKFQIFSDPRFRETVTAGQR